MGTKMENQEESRVCKYCGRTLLLHNFAKNQLGYTHVCKECNSVKRSEGMRNRKKNRCYQQGIDDLKAELEKAKEEALKTKLQDFTPRQLMEELARRGYRGKLEYTYVKQIDITNF